MENKSFKEVFNEKALEAHQIAHVKGFWDDKRGKAECIALMHSELSECLEGIRKPGQDKHLPHRTNEEVELADCVIRIMDYAWAHSLDVGGAIEEKMAFNATREHKHGKKF